ncbi:MAG: hypothetical protein QOI74_1537, partial [Micromonosporaceae bacterium]|nr:hypothetical protein [Micromonosporaceae bacterium]
MVGTVSWSSGELGVADEVRVDPAVLRTGARVCGELHAALTRDEAGIEGATTDAARGLEGWYTKRALEDLLWWLRDDSGRGR